MNYINIHNLSPLIYSIYVRLIMNIVPIPNSNRMKILRLVYNLYMSLLSFVMLCGIIIGTYETNKFDNLYNFICTSYDNNYNSVFYMNIFLYSKYIEYFDTLFLVLSGKSISWLQYTHHGTTALLMYNNIIPSLSPYLSLFVMMNCFVHIPMYWYFAYPHGFLYQYRQFITVIQIVQHVISVIVLTTTFYIDDCTQNYIGHIMGTLLYGMYLLFFVVFYLKKYI